jgi:Ca2+-binding RTX toxin-like protein
LSDGGFVVTWARNGGIHGRLYGSDGAAQGSEFRIGLSGQDPAVTGLPDGGFVATWWTAGIHGQRYDADGDAVGAAFRVSSGSDSNQRCPSVAALPEGGFLVTWSSLQEDGTGGTYARQYDAAGNAVDGQFLVSAGSVAGHFGQDVIALDSGKAIVTWVGDDGSSAGIFGRELTGGRSDIATVTIAVNNLVMGTSGDDTLTGTGGVDVIVGLGGSDTLTGGDDADRFDYDSIDDGADTIADFTPGSGGDVLDVADVLAGYAAGTSDPANFVQLLEVGSNTQVLVNPDGVDSDFVLLATLQGVVDAVLGDLLTQGNLAMS